MEIQSAFNSGVQGFQKATEDANKAAADIAQSTRVPTEAFGIGEDSTEAVDTPKQTSANPPDLNQAVVDLKVAEHQAKASAEVIQSADESLGTLLDVRV